VRAAQVASMTPATAANIPTVSPLDAPPSALPGWEDAQ
jgi:hypothetical protein